MANKREETISKHRISAAVDRHPSHQPPHTWASELKKYLGSKACDPITILDDGESDATEISYVDLENDDDTFPKRHHSVSNKRIKAGNRCSGMQATVKNPHYSDDNHNTKESKPTKHTEKVIHPLFRVLTEDEVPVPNLQAAPEDCSMGLKAWPKTHGSLAKTAPIMQTKAISQSSSIALFNKERTKNAIRKDRDAPQYDMSVLSSKRKRTIGELGYDELISPAQIESPSEKLVRMARKCRQRPKRCDTSLQCVEGTAKRPAQATKVSRNNEKKSTQSNETTVKRNASGTVPVKRQLTSTYVLNYSETGASTPFSNIRAPLSDSYTSATTVSNLPKTEPIVKSHASLLSLKSEIGQLESPVKHRITAGKGLSQETLKRFQETRDWNCSMEVDQNADEAQNEETQVPNIAYGYFVQKREWLEIEEDAVQSTVGPFHTMDEANTVAKAEVQSPQIDGYEGIQSMGWSYYYEQDENGMQKHMARVLEIHVETIVYRELMPASKRASIPNSAFIVAPRVYIVHELQWLPNSTDDTIMAPAHCQSLTHGVFTLLKQANQRAAAEYLESLTGNWENSEYDVLKRTEMKSDLDKKARALSQENDYFNEEIKLDKDGFAKVWVDAVVVEGPRN